MKASKEEQGDVVRFFVAEVPAMAIKSRRPGMLSDGIILLHDNVHPHAANLVRDRLRFSDLAEKHFNVLHTAKIFPPVTSIFLAT